MFSFGIHLYGESASSPDTEVAAVLKTFDETWSTPIPIDDPRFGIIRVLSLLDFQHPGLDQVKAAADRGDHASAGEALLAYFRKTRQAKPELAVEASETDRLHANDALKHYFRGNRDVFPPIFRGGEIDWTGRAFANGKEIHDAEWYLQFQRLTWWPPLARAYGATGDERYFREWRYELVDWARELLPFTRKTPEFVSRGMETYYRCEALATALPWMLRSKDFDLKTLQYFLVSFHDQANHIPSVYAPTGNHRLGELTAVFRNGVTFPEFKQSSSWRQDGLTLLPEMLDANIYEDGMNRELVFSYHSMYVGLFMDAWKLFRDHGYEHQLPAHFRTRLLKMAEVYTMQSFPDFTLCQFGDAWKQRNPSSLFRETLAPLKKEIPYYDFMASGGKRGTPPVVTNIAYPQSGFYFFRSAWSPDAVFLALKCGETAFWHNQPDNGTFEFYAYGRNFMNDSGCYLYGSSDPEDVRWRDWFRSTKAHQTLTLNQANSECRPQYKLWKDSAKLTVLVVENQSYPSLLHRRTVIALDRCDFLIHDEAIGTANGELELHFQLTPCAVVMDDTQVRTQYPEGPNLQIFSFPTQQAPVLEKEEGWISYSIRQKQERPAWCWKRQKDASTPEVDFLTALFPSRSGATRPTPTATIAKQAERRIYQIQREGGNQTIEVNLATGVAELR